MPSRGVAGPDHWAHLFVLAAMRFVEERKGEKSPPKPLTIGLLRLAPGCAYVAPRIIPAPHLTTRVRILSVPPRPHAAPRPSRAPAAIPRPATIPRPHMGPSHLPRLRMRAAEASVGLRRPLGDPQRRPQSQQ